MFRAGRLFLVAVALCAAPVRGQQEEAPSPPESVLERYLEDRGLSGLLAAYLLERLKTAEGDERQRLADRLGSIYVQLLDKASTPQARQEWEAKSQDLLRAVPEADSFDLRLNLGKARYLQAEEIAERHRLRLATPEERQEAERALRTVGATFADIGSKINRRVEALEKREATGRDEEAAAVRSALSEARRLRSLAMYYTGWSEYYSSFLAGKPAVDEALGAFGWLLNAAGGRQANVERVPASLMRYEHVARAALGCALCESLRGRDGAALLWLDAVESAEGLAPAVQRQVFPRRLVVLAGGKRWADLEYMIGKRRQPTREEPIKPLEAADARLLAVLTLDALRDGNLTAVGRELVQGLADTAMTDLVTLGEVRQVQDLVNRYGTAPLGGEGFIVQYIRGLQAYERARDAHAATGRNVEEPIGDDTVRNLYREAARTLEIAGQAADAARFAEERGNSGLLLGLSLFYAGDLQEAADRFERAFQVADGSTKYSEDSLWLAIVALDKAVEGGRPSLKDRLARLSALYLKTFPRSERAARLLLRQAGTDVVAEEKAVEVLLGVEPDSPLYEAARRQAATLLYNIYRRAKGNDRDFAALRFAEVSEELIRFDAKKLAEGDDGAKKEATAQLLVRVRQLLDAVLGMAAPDLDRAEKAFTLLDTVVAEAGLDVRKVEDEITYRKLQVALARAKTDDATRHLDRLHALGGRFSDAADRMMYKRALGVLSVPNPPPGAAVEVVRHGTRVMQQFGRDAAALRDPAVYSLHNTVADAAARVWKSDQDSAMRDIAVEIDRNLLGLGNPPAQVLRRFAELAEASGDKTGALDAWRLLLSGLNPTAPEWFEARYHSLRLLLATDRPAAVQAMAQHRVLHPDFGPEPWGPRLRELSDQIGPAPAPTPATVPTGGTGQ